MAAMPSNNLMQAPGSMLPLPPMQTMFANGGGKSNHIHHYYNTQQSHPIQLHPQTNLKHNQKCYTLPKTVSRWGPRTSCPIHSPFRGRVPNGSVCSGHQVKNEHQLLHHSFYNNVPNLQLSTKHISKQSEAIL